MAPCPLPITPYRVLAILLVASTLASCQSALPASVAQATTTSSPHPLPTAIPPSSTLTPTADPSPTSTSTRPPATLTPLPTLQEPLAEIRRLYRNNGTCRLPCWWGITPGTTTWLEVSQFFARFADRVIVEQARGRQATSLPYQRFIAYYDAPDLPIDYAVSTFFHVSEGKVRWLQVDAESSTASGFTVAVILQQLGNPDAILVTQGYLTLWYETGGFAASFLTDQNSPDSHDRVCVISSAGILAWDPVDQLSHTQSRIWADFGLASRIEDVSPMDKSAFASAFEGGREPVCLPLEQQQ